MTELEIIEPEHWDYDTESAETEPDYDATEVLEEESK